MYKRKCAWCGEWMYFRPRDTVKMFCSKQCSNLYKEAQWAKDDGPEMPPLDASKISDEGYIALVDAIVSRAGQDITKYKPDTQVHKDARKFFESEYFGALTGLDGQTVLKELLKNWGKKKSELRAKNPEYRPRIRRARCLENGAVYESVKEAAKVFGLNSSSIQEVCGGRRKSVHGLHFEYVKEGDDR